jgi:N-acetyl-anhydromuramyl-L-alanine amidase AmpD
MYPFDEKKDTDKKSLWTNACTGIVIHHTAWWTFESNMVYLSTSPAKASVHFVIWPNGECGKIWDPKDILRHAWNGSRWWCENVNTKFLWIEVVGFGEYNIHQLVRLTDLVEYLMWTFPIDRNNIIRHSDCTQARTITKDRILRDWIKPVKKRDIWLPFFVDNLHFKKWRDQLIPIKSSRFKS